jgi:hypothetical protein
MNYDSVIGCASVLGCDSGEIGYDLQLVLIVTAEIHFLSLLLLEYQLRVFLVVAPFPVLDLLVLSVLLSVPLSDFFLFLVLLLSFYVLSAMEFLLENLDLETFFLE